MRFARSSASASGVGEHVPGVGEEGQRLSGT